MDDGDHNDKERRAIVERYDRGRGIGAQIDDWEDPDLPLYHTTDRYGFIHEDILPKLKSDEVKRIQLETDRVTKWVRMKEKWVRFKDSEKLRQRVYKGIPDRVRGTFWAMMMDLEKMKLQHKGKYKEMLKIGREYSPDVRQIDLDVNRTYRDHIHFRERFSVLQISLFNILCAYSVYNTEVGYCQGMSQIAALLLMYLAEEDAFWALQELMTNPKYAMHGFFVHGFPKLARFQAHHDRVLKKMLPRLKKHFDKHGVDSGLYTLKWFFQCFLDRVPFELALRFWDIYFLEGERVLICGAFTILKLHSKQLLARKNMDDILGYMQSRIPADFGMDHDKVIEQYEEYVEELHRKRLDLPGPPGDNESPTKPFGCFEIPVPAPVPPLPQVVARTPSPPPVPVPSPSPPPVEEPEDRIAPERNNSLRISASEAGHHLMKSRINPTRIKVPPPVSPRNPKSISPNPLSSRNNNPSPRNDSPSSLASSSPPISPRKIRSNSPTVMPSPTTRTNPNSSTTSSGVITLRIHVPYASMS